MNTNSLINAAVAGNETSACFATKAWYTPGHKTISVQAYQVLGRELTSSGDPLLTMLLGSNKIKGRKATTIVPMMPEIFLEKFGPSIELTKEQLDAFLDASETTVIFERREEGAPLDFSQILGAPVGIEITESHYPNPFRSTHEPVYNPRLQESVKAPDADGTMELVYLHTQLRLVGDIEHQFKNQLTNPDCRKYDRNTEARVDKAAVASTGTVDQDDDDATNF